MGTITTSDSTEIFYKDWGSGQPIVFSDGWPLSADDWDAQMLFFLHHGYRVVAADRRGHGRSSQIGDGHVLWQGSPVTAWTCLIWWCSPCGGRALME
jgi:non-heme chloroperoxidase